MALTGKLEFVPTVKVVLALLVNAGGVPMLMVTSTVWLSTVTEAVVEPVPDPAVKVEVATPPLKVVLPGLALPSEPPLNEALVPLGTKHPL